MMPFPLCCLCFSHSTRKLHIYADKRWSTSMTDSFTNFGPIDELIGLSFNTTSLVNKHKSPHFRGMLEAHSVLHFAHLFPVPKHSPNFLCRFPTFPELDEELMSWIRSVGARKCKAARVLLQSAGNILTSIRLWFIWPFMLTVLASGADKSLNTLLEPSLLLYVVTSRKRLMKIKSGFHLFNYKSNPVSRAVTLYHFSSKANKVNQLFLI